MAANNMKAVKLRIKSVQSTMQITKAMELVASSKLRKAKERADVCRPYFRELHQTLQDIANGNIDFSSAYARESANPKSCYVVIAGDRGLAGGYNTNLFKCLEADAEGKDYVVLPVGKNLWNISAGKVWNVSQRPLEKLQRFLLRIVLRWQIFSAESLEQGNTDISSCVTQTLSLCCLRFRL